MKLFKGGGGGGGFTTTTFYPTIGDLPAFPFFVGVEDLSLSVGRFTGSSTVLELLELLSSLLVSFTSEGGGSASASASGSYTNSRTTLFVRVFAPLSSTT